MIWLTNLLFPQETPKTFKTNFTAKGCPTWYTDPNRTPAFFNEDFLVTRDWTYSPSRQTIEYVGREEIREPPHAFPFFFLSRRDSSRNALIKRNFLCQNTRVQAEVNLGGAAQAGVLFRGIGERNFWAALLTVDSGLELIRVKDGERIVVARLPGLGVSRKQL